MQPTSKATHNNKLEQQAELQVDSPTERAACERFK